jgi:hypothetical protein
VFTATAIIAATETMRAAVAHLEVGGIEPEIGPFAVERPVKEGVDAFVDT